MRWNKILSFCLAIVLTLFYAVFFFWVEFPTRLLMDIYFARKFGSGFRLENDPVRTELKVRLTHCWLCIGFIGCVADLIWGLKCALLHFDFICFAGILVSLQWLCPFQYFRPAVEEHALSEEGIKYHCEIRRLTIDSEVLKITRLDLGSRRETVTLSCLCETAGTVDQKRVKLLTCGHDYVDVQGLFSVSAFEYREGIQLDNEPSRDYGLGVLRVIFSDAGHLLQITRWLPMGATLASQKIPSSSDCKCRAEDCTGWSCESAL